MIVFPRVPAGRLSWAVMSFSFWGAEYMSANHPSRSAVDAVPHESRSSICMKSSIISAFAATLIVFSVSKAIAMDDVSSVLVNPTEEKKISDEDR